MAESAFCSHLNGREGLGGVSENSISETIHNLQINYQLLAEQSGSDTGGAQPRRLSVTGWYYLLEIAPKNKFRFLLNNPARWVLLMG
jgi:hypothetical protein